MRGAVAALLLLGCARAGAAVPVVASVAHRSPEFVPPSEALQQRIHALRDGLALRGVSFQGIAASGFIAHNGSALTPFDVPAGRCLSVVALASAGVHDLDAQLFDPDGDMLVEDVEGDAHPTVQLCADAPRRVFHLVSAYDGQGAYVVGSFVSDRAGLEAVARAVGGQPGAAGSTGPAQSELERRVSALRDGIARRGFHPTGEPSRQALSAGGRVRVAFQVTPDRCYTFGAFADGDLLDVNASLLDGSGEELARDVRGERDALMQICPRYPTTVSVEATGVRGEGAVVFQAWSADAAAAGGATALWLGERTSWRGAAGTLDEAAREGRARVEAVGFRGAAVPDETLSLAAGDLAERPRRLAADGCTGFLASAGRGVGRVDLSLHDADGGLVARGESAEGGALAVACGPRPEALSLRIGVEAGGGDVLLRQFEGPAAAWMSGLDATAVGEAWAAWWAHPDARWVRRADPTRVRVGVGARPVRVVTRAAGRCVRVVMLSGAGLPLLSLVARDAAGRTVQRATVEGRVTLARCGDEAETLRVELGADAPGEAARDALWMIWDERGASAPGRP